MNRGASLLQKSCLLLVFLISNAQLLGADTFAVGETPSIDEGVLLPWTEGENNGYIYFTIHKNRLLVLLLDTERKIVHPEGYTAIVHYRGTFKKRSQQTVQLQADAQQPLLTSPRIIPPPHDYMCRLLLMKIVSETATGKTETVTEQAYPFMRLRPTKTAQ